MTFASGMEPSVFYSAEGARAAFGDPALRAPSSSPPPTLAATAGVVPGAFGVEWRDPAAAEVARLGEALRPPPRAPGRLGTPVVSSEFRRALAGLSLRSSCEHRQSIAGARPGDAPPPSAVSPGGGLHSAAAGGGGGRAWPLGAAAPPPPADGLVGWALGRLDAPDEPEGARVALVRALAARAEALTPPPPPPREGGDPLAPAQEALDALVGRIVGGGEAAVHEPGVLLTALVAVALERGYVQTQPRIVGRIGKCIRGWGAQIALRAARRGSAATGRSRGAAAVRRAAARAAAPRARGALTERVARGGLNDGARVGRLRRVVVARRDGRPRR